MELLRQNLAIEPDLQNFVRLTLSAVNSLGGNCFAAAVAMLDITQKLRDAGAGTGYPLPAVLVLAGKALSITCDGGVSCLVARLRDVPSESRVTALRHEFQQSTEATDPALLLRRNTEMMRYLDETRARTERELSELQASLDKRQRELHESIRQAETDSLTGLLNRRAFDERLGAAFRHTLRQRKEPLSLVLLDLDYFKQINDEHGHQYGDEYLCRMAQAMRDVIRRDVDAAFRFGGDEFAMLIFADAVQACAKARRVIEAMGGKVSIGIASITDETPATLTLEAFVHNADNALYQAKRAGRGRVVVDVCCPTHAEGCITECFVNAAA